MSVDDDDIANDLVSAALHQLGIAETTALSDPREALRRLTAAKDPLRPDLLIFDLYMPEMDGVEFIRHLGHSGFRGELILLSGADSRILRTVEELGASLGLAMLGAVEKPVTLATLKKLLERRSPRPHPAGTPPLRPLLEELTEEQLSAGLRQGRLETVYQPKVSVASRRVLGVECLARWRDADGGLHGPDRFIALAERSGLIGQVTEAVFRQAVAWQARWRREGWPLRMAVNLSTVDLGWVDLPDKLANLARQAEVPCDQICLEVTETQVTGEARINLDVVSRLRLKGFLLSIDDFGTGYSTMDKLHRLPFSELKLDRMFVAAAPHDSVAYSILESSVLLGRALGLNIVAEGVETPEEWAIVARLGCHEAQGYLLSRPLPPEQLPAWCSAWETR